jgi:hypothetical protein
VDVINGNFEARIVPAPMKRTHSPDSRACRSPSGIDEIVISAPNCRSRNRKINAPVAGVLCQFNAAVMPDRCSVRPIGVARACSTVRSALPGRFATDVAANHAVPGHAKSSAGRAAVRSGDAGNRVVSSAARRIAFAPLDQLDYYVLVGLACPSSGFSARTPLPSAGCNRPKIGTHTCV